MKPNVLKISSLIIMVIIMCVFRIKNTHANRCGCTLNIFTKSTSRFVWIENNTVLANSEDRNDIFTVQVPETLDFYMYDIRKDRFICTNFKNNKLEPKRIPHSTRCLFQEQTFSSALNTAYIQYVNKHNDYIFRFNKLGYQPTQKQQRTRHKHRKPSTNLSGFLPSKICGGRSQCVKKEKFCLKMSKRKNKLPQALRTFCAPNYGNTFYETPLLK